MDPPIREPALSTENKRSSDLAARFAKCRAALLAEIGPRTTLEKILVEAVARHAVGMEAAAEAELIAQDCAAKNASLVQLCQGLDQNSAVYLAGLTSPLVSQAVRFRVQHERAFRSAIRELREASKAAATTPNLFGSEDACVEYLAGWQRTQLWSCPDCGSDKRCWLGRRLRFECHCQRQFSVRFRTIFAGSRVPLLAWFNLVAALITAPDLSAAELSRKISVVRRATVREMAARIRDALASTDSDTRLAGLPALVASYLRQVYQRITHLSVCPAAIPTDEMPPTSGQFRENLAEE